jgi:hypothetical protein
MIRCAAVIACAVAFIGCSSDSTPRSNSSSASAPTSTTAPTTSTTLPLLPAGSPQEAAARFVTAWHAGDHAAALAIALPVAVESVFAAGDPGPLENRGCNSPPVDSPVLCVYKTQLGELQVRTQPRPDGWIVDQAILSAA